MQEEGKRQYPQKPAARRSQKIAPVGSRRHPKQRAPAQYLRTKHRAGEEAEHQEQRCQQNSHADPNGDVHSRLRISRLWRHLTPPAAEAAVWRCSTSTVPWVWSHRRVHTRRLHQIQPRRVARRSGGQRHWASTPSTTGPGRAIEPNSTLQPKIAGGRRRPVAGTWPQRAGCPVVCPTEDPSHQARRQNPPARRPLRQPGHVGVAPALRVGEPTGRYARGQCLPADMRRSVSRDKRDANLPHAERQCAVHRPGLRAERAFVANRGPGMHRVVLAAARERRHAKHVPRRYGSPDTPSYLPGRRTWTYPAFRRARMALPIIMYVAAEEPFITITLLTGTPRTQRNERRSQAPSSDRQPPPSQTASMRVSRRH